MLTVIDPLNPGSGKKRFFEGREGELLAFLSVPGSTQKKAAEHFRCALRTVELELARLRKQKALAATGVTRSEPGKELASTPEGATQV